MSTPARLTAPDGGTLHADALTWRAARLGRGVVARARRHAFREGRVIERDGAAVLSWGLATRLEFPLGSGAPAAAERAHELLSAIPGRPDDDEVSHGPVALGALPFDTSARGALVIPGVTVVDDGDDAFAVAVGRRMKLAEPGERLGFALHLPEDGADDDAAPDRFRVDSVLPHGDFLARVRAARDAISAGEFDKVVLAREVAIRANRAFRQYDLLERIRALHPTCAAFAIDGFVGASPELLVRRRGRAISSRPLAGTVARSGDAQEDARLAAGLLSSAKDRLEHRYVVDAITACFSRHADDVAVPDTPELLELRNVTHLATPVAATLHESADGRLFERAGARARTPSDARRRRHTALRRPRLPRQERGVRPRPLRRPRRLV